MNVHSKAQAGVNAPASLQGPESDTSDAPFAAGDEPTLKKKKKLLNGTDIKFTFPSGATYEGSFKDGRIEGYGIYAYAKTGDVYEGEWKADLKHGYGRYTFANGDKYVGQWYMGNKHGKGQFAFFNGDEYVGSWKENQMNGYGVFLLASKGDRYEGYWREGIRQGQGSLYYDNGDLYDGEWCSGLQDGLGVFCQSNDDLYCGQWHDGTMDGKGVLREKGILFLVEYVGGYLISKQRQSEALDETEKEWEPAYRHYLAWIEHHQGPVAPTRSRKEEDRLTSELQAAHAENSILRKRFDDLLALHRQTGRSANAGGESHPTFHSAALEEAGAEYWKESMLKVESKLKLLECTLAERVVELRKLGDQLKSRDARVHELELEKVTHKLGLHGAKHRSANETLPFEAPTQSAQQSPTEMDTIDADEVEELKEKNALLTRMNDELQQKAAFLAAENAKLTLKEEAAEDQYNKLLEEMVEIRATLENERCINMDSQQLKASVTDAAETDSKPGAAQAPSPVSLSLTAERNLEAQELQQRLTQAKQLNIDLRLRIDKLERTTQAKPNDPGSPFPSQEAAGLARENEVLRSLAASLKTELAAMHSASSNAEQKITLARQRQVELEDALKTITRRKAPNPQLQETLEWKSERIASLELENAELARLLDETRADAEQRAAISAAMKLQPSIEPMSAGSAGGELASVQKEVKKLQRRIKKLTAERNDVAEQLYQSQVRLARRDRALAALQGQLIVVASITNSGGGAAVEGSATRVDAADPTKLVLCDCGEETFHQYDFCFDKDACVEQLFAELCGPLAFVWSGYQFALMTVGELRSGKSGLVKDILPFFTKYLSKAAEEDPKRFFFSFTYRVAIVEISAHGGFDCASGEAVTEVNYDSNGFVQPRNVHFIDCTSGSIPSVVDSLLTKRRQHYNGRSHTWIQLQCVRTNVVRQCQTIGRLTIFDWCGSGSLASQSKDIESARFANASSQALRGVVTALAGKLPVIPYTKSVEVSLLFDLLGGNSVTAVVGRIRSSVEHVEETLRTLHVLTSLFGVRNGPLLPDNQTSDEIRWRGIVAALASDHQAERELQTVENIREC
ncbi:phosphatidylinositol-4-phosphate 5-kinase-like protein [Leishmania braziliensis MHOM/BR/75/M2904]|uniref:Phosphatidylinositol-4-phosphate 5-kinase-like protein n=2 Tax=Leishmania braziliensis TaxID=5660 RepID=A4HJQ8_LEIBR|nr:phosphatidylinositol-4-phosphate 5-kinase-like protein [Leishmania braziliensis MHOM/BR/75/M2904]CAM42725.2 phosphatidylinositol-4-phosphate 5-kinase-like protein [Leishmania braziliensis MHOM/BR/75/M2904]SYZ68452.1 phosphatidylinositol-4-phosphate_5-kinase-like_protein [Leishmania braziliensis MHOM/BR/75/M2904]